MSKESFKVFARLNPSLANFVINNDISWQKIYELYEIYGENSSIWNNYIEKNNVKDEKISRNIPLNDLFNSVKNMDLNSVQKGVNNIQKTIDMLKDLGLGSQTNVNNYVERPMYKYFED